MMELWRMKNRERYAQDTSVSGLPCYDVIVVGGGTAGAIAALACARKKFRVLIVERMNCLGGMGTAGHIEGYYFGSRGGLYESIDAESKAYEPLGYPVSGASSYNAELKKRILEKRVREAGAEILYEADLTGVLMEGNRVAGVEWVDSKGLGRAVAGIVIDATAEGYVCMLAGAKYSLGRDLDHKVQPYGNVRITFHPEHMANGHAYTDCGYESPVDPESYARAILNAARFPCYLLEDYRQGTRLLAMTPNVGMREGLMVEGEDRLRMEEVVDRSRKPEKTLFIAYSNADNHGKDMAFENSAQQDWMIACSLWGLNFSVPVPMGCVIPKGLDGLLMAGRLISVDHDLASCIRMERDVQKCGEGVGLLAAESLRQKVDVRDVDYASLEKLLRENNCLMEANDVGFVDSRQKNGQGRCAFPQTLEEIRDGLAGTEPGMAMWAARKIPDPEPLRRMMGEGGEHLPIHAAMALALRGDDSGAELLVEAVRKQDCFIPTTGRKFNMIRGAAALYLLGRLSCAPALEDILGIITGWREITSEHFQRDEFLADLEEYRFQYLSQAVVAAMNISNKYPEYRDKVDSVIHSIIDAPEFSIHSTLKGGEQIKYQMAPLMRRAVECLKKQRIE